MSRYALMVLATPKTGTEDRYNDWHMNTHVPQVLNLPGWERTSAVRYGILDTQFDPKSPTWKFLTIYEIETDDIEATLTRLKTDSASGTVGRTDDSDPSKTVILGWKLISEHPAND